MEIAYAQVALDALSLPIARRAELVRRLIMSLELEDEASVEAAWRAEALRRLEEIDSGAVVPIDGEEVFRELRAELR